MELLQEVANISGKPGLFRILKPGRGGVIVESLDALKKKEMINANSKVSVLKEISVYTEDINKSTPLSEIFMSIRENYKDGIDINPKEASNNTLFDFMGKVMPDFDKERVYATDVKKIINWYNILSQYLPEAFEAPKEEEKTEEKK
ncbi:MAG: DUF5606 domain-containing protein [Spirosomataceae bacterium]|jgi:hypothetical protein|nr:DUF5606 domain-containing protein [Bacteroidota bacterium]